MFAKHDNNCLNCVNYLTAYLPQWAMLRWFGEQMRQTRAFTASFRNMKGETPKECRGAGTWVCKQPAELNDKATRGKLLQVLGVVRVETSQPALSPLTPNPHPRSSAKLQAMRLGHQPCSSSLIRISQLHLFQ